MLKKCPFCGKEVAVVDTVAACEGITKEDCESYEEYDWKAHHYTVVCDYTAGGCGSSTGGFYENPEAAEDAWNTRV